MSEEPLTDERRVRILKSPEAIHTTITEHWGQRDQPAVVEYALQRFSGYKLVIVGHSVGGRFSLVVSNDKDIFSLFSRIHFVRASSAQCSSQ